MTSEIGELQKNKGKRRIAWIGSVVVLLVVSGVVVINLSAAKANGADAASGEAAETEGENGDQKQGKAPVPVEIVAVDEGDISSYITTSANLVAENEVRLLSEVEGRVARLLVDEGDFVRKGQHLAGLVRDDEEITLRKAELKETNARLAYERGEDLSEKELISREEFDKFKMDFEIAQQEKAEAEWQLQKTMIKAPFAGQISERMIQVGQNLRRSDELFQLTDVDPLVSRIFLPERDVIGLEEGREARITLNADTETRFTGRIRQVSPVVDTATGTIKVTIEAIDPPANVRSGSFVTIDIIRETRSEVVLVPREAVLRELQSVHVFVFAEDGKAEKRQIELGLEEGSWVEAVAGLRVGDKVIVAGQGGLKEGTAVKLVGVESEATNAEEES
ncbi:MAG: efflux RND transporter periplasmic adaptor subunit [Acidobacteria bacterium]|nr:efflux RND transporter periplasmic adaptor subunit [Acidobacteriota bacterium]